MKRHLSISRGIVYGYAAIILLFCWSLPFAQTNHSGTISSNETWLAAGNPHVVTANVTINLGVVVTIDPGCEVMFDNATRINIYGELNAQGTSTDSILFTRNGAGVSWFGLYYLSNSSGILSYCTFEYAQMYPSSVGIKASSALSISVTHCVFQNIAGYNGYGFYGNNVAPTLTDNIFRDNGKGIYLQNATSPVIGANNTFIGNGRGIYISNCTSPQIAAGNVISDNDEGVLIYNSSSPQLASGTIISDNTEYGIYYQSSTSLGTIDNLTLTNNGGYGAFRFANSGDFTLGAGNTIGGVGNENEWPLTIDAGSFPSLSSVIPTTGNTNNDIRVTSGNGTEIGTYHLFTGLQYIITENPMVYTGGSLTIAPGNTLKFNAATQFSVYGTLIASGTASDSILFTKNGDGQEWTGLICYNGSTGDFDYCIIEHASAYPSGRAINANGADTISVSNCVLQHNQGYNGYGFYGNNVAPTLTNNIIRDNKHGIYISSSTSPIIGVGNTITDNDDGIYFYQCDAPQVTAGTIISGNTNYGIYYYNCTSLGTIDNLTLTSNGGYGAFRFANSGDFNLGAGNTIGGAGNENEWAIVIDVGCFPDPSSVIPTSGNTNNQLRVTSGSSTTSGTWPLFTTHDYYVTEPPTINPTGSLTLDPGTTLLFNQSTYLSVYGVLNASGTVSDSITFTKSDSGATWGGVQLLNGSSGDLDFCIIEYAGMYPSGVAVRANQPDTVSVENCRITNNAGYNGYGFYGDNVNPVITNNVFKNNGTGIYLQNSDSPVIGSGNVISNNTRGIYFYNCIAPQIAPGTPITDHTDYGIYYDDCDSLGTIDNLILRRNGGYGAFRFANSGDFILGGGNTIGGTGNENEWALVIDVGCFPDSSCVIPTTGNTNNQLRVTSGNGTKSGVWPLFATHDYYVTETPTLNTTGALTIDPGTTLLFNQGTRFSVYGELNAQGTVSDSITFTRSDSGVTWGGVQLLGGSSGDLDYCIIEHASIYPSGKGISANSTDTLSVEHCVLRNNVGYSGYGFFGDNVNPTLNNNTFLDNGTGIYISNSSHPAVGTGNVISNNVKGVQFFSCITPQIAPGTIISNHSDYGVYYNACDSIGTIDNLIVTNCGDYGAFRFTNSGDFALGAGNTIGGTGNENEWPVTIDVGSFPLPSCVIPTSGNTNNHIRVTSGNGTKTGTWSAFPSVNYIVTETPVINTTGNLTIAAGNNVKFNENLYLHVYGSLTTAGTAGNYVTFTRNASDVDWRGLQFHGNSSIGDLNYSIIEYASTYPSGAGVKVNSADSIHLDHCILQYNTGYNNYGYWSNNETGYLTNNTFQDNTSGIYLTGANTPIMINNQFAFNNSHGIYIYGDCTPTFGTGLSEWNDAYGNGGFDLYNGTANITAEYIFWGTTNYGSIANNVYDYCEDLTRGAVDFIPYTNAPHDSAYYADPGPENLVITVNCDSLGCDSLYLSWCPMPGATSYTVYYSDEPAGTFQQDLTGTFNGTSWAAPFVDVKRFYYVTAND